MPQTNRGRSIMAKKKIEENVDLLDKLDIETAEPIKDNGGILIDETPKSEPKPGDVIKLGGTEEPEMTDPRWSDFVLLQLQDNEKDAEGHPKVNGLRRVAQLLIGPIIKSEAKVVQAPDYIPNCPDRFGIMCPAVVEHTIVVLNVNRLPDGVVSPYEMKFTEVGDVHKGNCDIDFLRHASSTASTKAESRALRKLLLLNNVISSEETTLVPIEESAIDGNITPTQINFIKTLCIRNDINVMKYINAGKEKYKQIIDIPHGTAIKMVEHLSGLFNDQKKIDPSIKGYDPKWENS